MELLYFEVLKKMYIRNQSLIPLQNLLRPYQFIYVIW
jgi:hypothetical protein